MTPGELDKQEEAVSWILAVVDGQEPPALSRGAERLVLAMSIGGADVSWAAQDHTPARRPCDRAAAALMLPELRPQLVPPLVALSKKAPGAPAGLVLRGLARYPEHLESYVASWTPLRALRELSALRTAPRRAQELALALAAAPGSGKERTAFEHAAAKASDSLIDTWLALAADTLPPDVKLAERSTAAELVREAMLAAAALEEGPAARA